MSAPGQVGVSRIRFTPPVELKLDKTCEDILKHWTSGIKGQWPWEMGSMRKAPWLPSLLPWERFQAAARGEETQSAPRGFSSWEVGQTSTGVCSTGARRGQSSTGRCKLENSEMPAWASQPQLAGLTGGQGEKPWEETPEQIREQGWGLVLSATGRMEKLIIHRTLGTILRRLIGTKLALNADVISTNLKRLTPFPST